MVGSNGLGFGALPAFLWQEARARGEVAFLALSSAAYRSQLFPHRPVLLVPDLHCSDLSLQLVWWDLTLRGLKVYFSELPVNLDNSEAESAKLQNRIRTVFARAGEPVDLVCHNQALELGQRLAELEPARVGKLVLLGYHQNKPVVREGRQDSQLTDAAARAEALYLIELNTAGVNARARHRSRVTGSGF